MKKYKYVVAAGCSFTLDPPYNNELLHLPKDGKSYGRLISEYFGAKYYELASPGYSLQGMHRKTLEWCSKNKDKFKDTLIIFGVTSMGRAEIWNNKRKDWLDPNLIWHNDCRYFQSPDSLLDTFKDRLLIHWPSEQRKNYFINFYNTTSDFFLITQSIISLQSFLTLYNIDHVFFDAYWRLAEEVIKKFNIKLEYQLLFDSLVSQENWYRHPEYTSMIDFLVQHPEMRHSRKDLHPNKEAHKYWAECLLEFINEKV